MNLYEIVREDDVVVFQYAKSLLNLENNYLFLLRKENKIKSFDVYLLDEDLNRKGKKVTYLPYENDKKAQELSNIKNRKSLSTLIDEIIFSNKKGFTLSIDEK